MHFQHHWKGLLSQVDCIICFKCENCVEPFAPLFQYNVTVQSCDDRFYACGVNINDFFFILLVQTKIVWFLLFKEAHNIR
jgi:hypothetical protein